jgi:predicted glycogen debranching enzyme
MTKVDTLPIRRVAGLDLKRLIECEWLVSNGLGGYASGTLAGAATRRYHGLLVAAHAAPLGRVMMFNHLAEQFRTAGAKDISVGGVERPGAIDVKGIETLLEFRLESGLPVWLYKVGDCTIEKRIIMPHRRNTVHVMYRLASGEGPVRLKLRPSVHFRGHDDVVSTKSCEPYQLTAIDRRYELSCFGTFPALRLWLEGGEPSFALDGLRSPEILYRIEEHRGYEGIGVLWSPGLFRVHLTKDTPVVLTGSTETWERALALPAEEALAAELERRKRLIAMADPAARSGFGAELVLAADQFVITPATRAADMARAIATGDDARTIVAGYHWFTDWGRDTMISLAGLTLSTGRHHDARNILRTFASHARDGLIPNYFPDRSNLGVYHTADASLLFFLAMHRYLEATGDMDTLRDLLPVLSHIAAKHIEGTRFGIGVDPKDGLLRQGEEGYQLTWMDAKCGDWVVTPRRGKAVEINAYWYNALKLLDGWLREHAEPSSLVNECAERCRESFNRRFWCEPERGLFDVIDGEEGNDSACRPNQLLAISLPFPVLDESKWKNVVDTCRERLFTPVGLRSLAPGHPEYKAKYFGDLRARDAAYHQGTVWAWLIGPLIDAFKKTYPNEDARQFLTGFSEHLSEACIGTISEVFDAEAPYEARGCAAQAWSVAEVLRCWIETSSATPRR